MKTKFKKQVQATRPNIQPVKPIVKAIDNSAGIALLASLGVNFNVGGAGGFNQSYFEDLIGDELPDFSLLSSQAEVDTVLSQIHSAILAQGISFTLTPIKWVISRDESVLKVEIVSTNSANEITEKVVTMAKLGRIANINTSPLMHEILKFGADENEILEGEYEDATPISVEIIFGGWYIADDKKAVFSFGEVIG